jgi:hypothetical protein
MNSHGTDFCTQDLEMRSSLVQAKDLVFLKRDVEVSLVSEVVLHTDVLLEVEVLQDSNVFLAVNVFLDREEVRDSSHHNFLDINYAPLALGRLAR